MISAQRVAGATDIWLTPRWLLDELKSFDLDPCAAPDPSVWPTAARHFTERGLDQPWQGCVWLNPPFSAAGTWVERLADHGDGVALVCARTETVWFQEQVLERADQVLFIRRRIMFHREDLTLPKAHLPVGMVLACYGPQELGAVPGVLMRRSS